MDNTGDCGKLRKGWKICSWSSNVMSQLSLNKTAEMKAIKQMFDDSRGSGCGG